MKFLVLFLCAFSYIQPLKHKSRNTMKQEPDDTIENPLKGESGDGSAPNLKGKGPGNAELMKKLDKAFSNTEPYRVGVEGWLRISSNAFQDPDRYPPIPNPDSAEEDDAIKVQVAGADGGKATPLQKAGSFRKNNKFGEEGGPPFDDAFFFRLSGRNLYFTEGKGDMVVMGAISIKNLLELTTVNLQ